MHAAVPQGMHDDTQVTLLLLLLLHRKFVDDFHKLGLPLHVLVNNAGVHLKVH